MVAPQLLHNASASWLTLRELPPGSHDSFTYWVDVNAPVGPDQKSYVKYLATMFSVVAKKVMVKWSMTQVVFYTFLPTLLLNISNQNYIFICRIYRSKSS